MRVVVDTNLFVSRLLFAQSVPARAVDRAMTEATLLASDATLAELADVLNRPKFDRWVGAEVRREFLDRVASVVVKIRISERITACRDPRDNAMLELAVNGRAQRILSGDDDLLAMSPFRGIGIVRPAEYLASG
ncbi:MAG: putative toxin-antitoxin system toxin component, PIN family [Deltaproteobacteria bacterium]|nr:putative toxin-antitoxin system toxin component, PIN family [Deltaproteobacteria bacterium]